MVNYFSGEHYLVKLNGGKGHQICIHYVYKSISSVFRANEEFPYAAIISFIERPCICPQQR